MSMETTLDLPVWMAIDLARTDAYATVYAAVDRILDRWKLHDFWVVEFEAFDVCEGVYVRNQFTFDTAKEAYKFKPGRAVTWSYDTADFDDELPF
ncbi:hypothetical protein DSJ_18790 [Pantoea stewartii subsp. stewartii DC283]|uniref:Uncharacterized protein n=2 Tax=Pantoea stewartii TaxID=66269 RepID=H3R936_PANSE|nr:hypothetical protein DSJ_18790 [Pantoea stewartii subsp. stewartii DC283]EHU01699.1 hypothetical protein CKS_0139 [Pantoea stewartii subsp. stewartii DC283]